MRKSEQKIKRNKHGQGRSSFKKSLMLMAAAGSGSIAKRAANRGASEGFYDFGHGADPSSSSPPPTNPASATSKSVVGQIVRRRLHHRRPQHHEEHGEEDEVVELTEEALIAGVEGRYRRLDLDDNTKPDPSHNTDHVLT
jgi:hypothetical protein